VIGRGAAVGVAYRCSLSGSLAWLMWLAIHITFLIGFRNRIAVLFNWAYVYFTRRRHAQIIVGSAPLEEGEESVERGRGVELEPAVQALQADRSDRGTGNSPDHSPALPAR
jgi:hypothetical protein